MGNRNVKIDESDDKNDEYDSNNKSKIVTIVFLNIYIYIYFYVFTHFKILYKDSTS